MAETNDKQAIAAEAQAAAGAASQAPLHIGIDVGSTTVKVAVLDDNNEILYSCYRRHHADIRATIVEVVGEAAEQYPATPMTIAITGSGGLLLAQWLGIDFVQEVIASKTAVETFIPQTDVVIELGGEDAKIIYFDNGIEQRMNGTCAGGTGAFIDQMAALLDTDAGGLNELAKSHTTIYPIASRCGVFAKTDVQPLLNEGARKEDIAASIFQAVVTQTISGLACGRPIRGNVALLGGPLQYLSELDKRFCETLNLDDEHAIRPKNAHLFVASGAALCGKKTATPELLADVLERLRGLGDIQGSEVVRLPPLFANEAEFDEFEARHATEKVKRGDLSTYEGVAYLGIDAGSTTFKSALIGEDGSLLWTFYANNKGDVLGTAKRAIAEMYAALPTAADDQPKVTIGHATVTGYGEGLLLEALRVDSGEIETVAHLRGAQEMLPGVEFILDIGGQDMKCLRVKDGVIDHIMLNEACSSGCGSFIESFAAGLNLDVTEFAKTANAAENPVDLGSRCTVFMNSRVKQAQKEGATVGDIAAGLAISVIKNALFKVIKIRDPKEVGSKVIVQGGTFLNDAILRSFEQEIGRDVTRPAISGLMGAYGAALHAKDNRRDTTTLIGTDILAGFEHNVRSTRCGLCENHCNLTINDFGGGRRFISGNRCERPLGGTKKADLPNLYKWKLEKLKSYGEPSGIANPIAKIGLPFGLNNFELLPFWTAFLRKLGFETVLSDVSTRDMYMQGQHSIPSDTVCYPAKLMHGHIENLLEKGVDAIFYPCMTYNLDEERATNHYNCPVVAYYPELLKANVSALADFDFMMPYFELADKKRFTKHAVKYFCGKYPQIKKKQVIAAVEDAYMAQDEYYIDVRIEGQRAIRYADEHGLDVAVIAGRPYHVDPEINHGIDQLIASFGLVIVSEDAVWQLTDAPEVHVLNQWTYHSRMYGAAKYVTQKENAQLIQLVSFGCGIDAITTDEMRAICENGGKIYTQLKIDEISNLGAAKIRIRSMLAAVEEGRKLAEQQNA